MPKNFFKKIIPDPQYLREHKGLSWIQHWLADGSLWHLNRRSVSRAVFIGIFCSFLPIPFQMLAAAALAVLLSANIALSVVLVWISNPVTMPFLFYGSYRVGLLLLGQPPIPMPDELSLEWLGEQLSTSWLPFLIGCISCGCFFGGIGWSVARGFWRFHVIRAWKNRHKNRK
ncbi:DUF2062 domain-containing protein [uncultured Umboniibacter sp.]|uniref:DUF2062 domain-containing protein n=1 Tax=uncultured Umboniibacter sp. TaxID=1798917 RepID=UPI0026240326|nr:DUF2062 domain-containing protein [uncultured Umboniibacter sp.]